MRRREFPEAEPEPEVEPGASEASDYGGSAGPVPPWPGSASASGGAVPPATSTGVHGGSASSSAVPPGGGPAAASAGPSAFRWYVVFSIPGLPAEMVGIYKCREPGAWQRLAALLPNGSYENSGARLARVADRAAGIRLWDSERRRHRLPVVPAEHQL